ncbi:nitroreductase family protein [Gorillibacterium massiliense]|uniref:nitroreductase family protein n=1 Tax=Gorillibacterium massiliense TaxID=1280390 RepID=UPI000594B08E|nr:nitroreductase family protein [Gorillibacterium massiliense]
MEIIQYHDSLFDSIQRRVSRRSYAAKPAMEELEELSRYAWALTAAAQGKVRIEVFADGAEDIFQGLTNSYGMISGARSFAAFIAAAPEDDADLPDEAMLLTGYYGEQFVLRATALGVATCWIAGSFDKNTAKRVASVRDKERLLCVSPLGHAEDRFSFKEKLIKGFATSRRRKPLQDIVANHDVLELAPDWFRVSLEAARVAPSAMNGQPWTFTLFPADESIAAQAGGKGHLAPLDLGIALSHLHIAAVHSGVEGEWNVQDGRWIFARRSE